MLKLLDLLFRIMQLCNITGGFSAGDFGGLIYSIENFDESEHEF